MDFRAAIFRSLKGAHDGRDRIHLKAQTERRDHGRIGLKDDTAVPARPLFLP